MSLIHPRVKKRKYNILTVTYNLPTLETVSDMEPQRVDIGTQRIVDVTVFL